MDLISKLVFRLGLVFLLAVSLRVIGGLFAPTSSDNTFAFNGHKIPIKGTMRGVLAAPLTDPIMQDGLQVLALVKRSTKVAQNGAKLTFKTPDSEVQLDAIDIEILNEYYFRTKTNG